MKFEELQLFAEGGDGASAGQGQGEAPAATQPEPGSADPNAEFEELIRGKYKEQYDSRVRDTIHRRLKGSRETAQRMQTLTPALNLLAQHYGVEPSDAQALARAVEGDDSFLRREADRRGMNVEALRNIRALEQENARLRGDNQHRSLRDHLQHQFSAWGQQAEAAKELYPELDMNVEVRDPEFRRMLLGGLDVSSAYLLRHRDEILAGKVKETEQRIAGRMMTAATRPSENGTAGQSGAVTRTDVASMSRADREAIRKRAARGERIRL